MPSSAPSRSCRWLHRDPTTYFEPRRDPSATSLVTAQGIETSWRKPIGGLGLNRGGHRQANAALYRTVIVRLRFHQPTIDHVARRTAEGKTKAEIIRCLKRYVAREVWAYLHPDRHQTPSAGLMG
jgi:hypothetical protein